MLICVSGSHSVGKSLFVAALKEQIQQLGIMKVVTRTSSSREAWQQYYEQNNIPPDIPWYHLECKHHEAYQELYLFRLKKAFHEMASSHELIILDRSFPDFIAYTIWKEQMGEMRESVSSRLVQEAIPFVDQFQFTVYLSPNSDYPIVDNGMRKPGRKDQLHIHSIFGREVLPRIPEDTLIIPPSGTTESRVQYAAMRIFLT